MDKNILQSGETLHLWAFLTDANNIRLNNQEVIFYKIKDGVKTQIGSSVTDSSGIAYFDYIGVGAGKISIGVERGIIQSEPYPVLDTLFYDKALSGTGNHNDNWVNNHSASVTRGDDGTTISKESYAAYFADNPSISAEYDWTAPFVVEVDIISTTGNANNMQIYDGDNTSNGTIYFSNNGVTENNTLKLVCDGSTIKCYVDGVEKPNAQVTATFNKCRCGLILGNGGTIKYKDFKIYPI